MGETDRARREIEDARQHLTEYADALFQRFSPEHLKAEARAKLRARTSEAKLQLRAKAHERARYARGQLDLGLGVAKDHLQHDRRTQVGTGVVALIGIGAIAKKLGELAASRRARAIHRERIERFGETTTLREDAVSYSPAAREFRGGPIERYPSVGMQNVLGPPPPLYGAGVIRGRRELVRIERHLGLKPVILGALSWAALRALSKRPEVQPLKEKARSVSDSLQQRLHRSETGVIALPPPAIVGDRYPGR